MSLWVIASIVLKVSVYLSVAAAIGGMFAVALIHASVPRATVNGLPGYRGTLVLCLLGLMLSTSYFLVRVGSFADSGPVGMFDPVLLRLLWESPVGTALQYRLIGFTLLASLAASTLLIPVKVTWYRSLVTGGYLVVSLLLVRTFSYTGHTSELGVIGSVAVTLHLMLALWWAGALYPLWRATHALETLCLQQVLHRFGWIASRLLVVMVAAGAVLLYVLLLAPAEDVSTGYAVAIIAKLGGVALLFLIAAHHKFAAVPRLSQVGGVAAFRRSLTREMLLMVSVLILTAIFSTVIGPLDV